MAVLKQAYTNYGAASLNAVQSTYWLCDTTAELPASGMKQGDLVYDRQTDTVYKATNATTLQNVATGVSFAAPAFTLGTSSSAGSAGTTVRTDATIQAFDATVPSTSVPGDTATPGTAVVAARRDHRHAREASLAQSSRSIWIPAQGMTVSGGSVGYGTAPDATQVIQLANGVTQLGVYTTFRCPAGWVTGTFLVRPVWAPDATDGTAHTVRWSMDVRALLGADVRGAGTTVAWTGDSSVHTVGVGYRETGQASTGFTPAAGDLVRCSLQRIGADAADTYTDVVDLIGIQIDYTSTI